MSKGRSALAINLKRLRKERGLSQKGLAEKAGISFRPIQLAESGDSGMDADSLVAVADCLGVAVDVLVRDPESLTEASTIPDSSALWRELLTILGGLDEFEVRAVLDSIPSTLKGVARARAIREGLDNLPKRSDTG